MSNVPYNLPFDDKVTRLKKRYQGLARVTAAINDLYIYGVYPSNYPNLTTVLEQAKDHVKAIIKETKILTRYSVWATLERLCQKILVTKIITDKILMTFCLTIPKGNCPGNYNHWSNCMFFFINSYI